MRMIRIMQIALDVLFPPLCVVCHAHLPHGAETVCETCFARIPAFGWRLCPTCGARLADTIPSCHPETIFTLVAASTYASREVQALIKSMKYDGIRRVADTLALFAAATARDVLEEELHTPASPADRRESWTMVPIPLHPRRERERGFNQSMLFAEALRRHPPLHTIPLVPALRRVRDTDTQTEKPDYKARRANVLKCFMATAPELIQGKNIFLVDDVATSGATLEEAARVLRPAGARRVVALVFAKA